jgi:8-amino-7-oxononanoate synthase
MKRTTDAAASALAALDESRLRRVRRCVDAGVHAPARLHVAGRELIDFCSNDYLGLARDPRLMAAMTQAVNDWGAGAGAAHLVSGHTREHHALEEELAAFTGREAALLFSTGYMANVGVITALAARGEIILQDRLNHASLLDGARQSDARLQRYAHADASEALRLLQAAEGRVSLLATDGIFSMDGDSAPLRQLAQLAKANDVWLLVDDAHGLGTIGAEGRGSVEVAGLSADDVPLLVGTLGKAFGSFGAFVAGDADVVELILQRARSYIYTTAMPPAIAAATRQALKIVSGEPWRRELLQQRITQFRQGAQQLGLNLMASGTAIQPLVVGDTKRCLAASDALHERGFWVTAIRAPTVPAGTERLRVTLSAAHTAADVDALLAALAVVLPSANGVS